MPDSPPDPLPEPEAAGETLQALVFSQVNVFSTDPLGGNPVAVVHGAGDLDEATMAAFARWTNLSETTFLLPPSHPSADYRLRIFTPGGELPFAGHPTLGSAQAWLEAGGRPAAAGTVVQECAAGLVTVRRDPDGGRLAFAAPPLVRSGPVDAAEVDRALADVGLHRDDLVDAAWVDNGPGWMGLLLTDADTVLRAVPRSGAELEIGIVGPHGTGAHGTGAHGAGARGAGAADVEVRAFIAGQGIPEDPVTGSLNAGLAQWLMAAGRMPDHYVAAQGTALGRSGRVHLDRDRAAGDGAPDTVWVGGECTTVVTGQVRLPAGTTRP